jgi:RNA polymerase sigma factor (sigma-70 family)
MGRVDRALTAEEREIVETQLPVARIVAQQLARRFTSSDLAEIEAIARAAIVEELPRFDPTQSSLVDFLYWRVTNRTLDVLRKGANADRRARLLRAAVFQPIDELTPEQAMRPDAPEEATLVHEALLATAAGSLAVSLAAGGESTAVERLDVQRARSELRAFVAGLEEPHRSYFEACHFAGDAIPGIAERFGVSGRTVDRSLMASRLALRAHFVRAGLI